jgi:hypothetical protein
VVKNLMPSAFSVFKIKAVKGGTGRKHSYTWGMAKPGMGLTKGNTQRYYWIMVVKSLKIPESLAARIQRQARATKRTVSAVMRDALERGLGEDAGIDMAEALKGVIGSVSGPGDLSTNKAYFAGYGRSRPR